MATNLPSPIELQLLALVVRERRGADVASRYAKEVGRNISPGTLYTTFRRLREAGWVKTRDSADEDGRVRFFKITASGSSALNRGREFYQGLSTFPQSAGLVVPVAKGGVDSV
jgi:DNA-binding PadR family transcriptional regulator